MHNKFGIIPLIIVVTVGVCLSATLSGCTNEGQTGLVSHDSQTSILLSDDEITVDGRAAGSDSNAAVYLLNDIVYYEDRDTYDSGNAYGNGTAVDKHTAEEAAQHTVVHITRPGTYRISGTLSCGQIAVDLGDEAKTDPGAVVTLVLDNADITSTVAPTVIFYNVYECDTTWVAYENDKSVGYTASAEQDTSTAGANIILADESVNNLNSSHVAEIYRDSTDQATLHKFEGACYSGMSMNFDVESAGSGILNIDADFEGIESALHLTINGGTFNIHAGNDAINSNETGISAMTINDGIFHLVAGLGDEGDGLDSNGYITINDGIVIANAKPASDSGIDSDLGSFINGGFVFATGSTMDWADRDSSQVTFNLQFASTQKPDDAIIVTDENDRVFFAYDPVRDGKNSGEARGYTGAVLSCPSLVVGDTYYIYKGGDISGSNSDGFFDVDKSIDFTGATRQIYTGTEVGRHRQGGAPGSDEPGSEPPESGDAGAEKPEESGDRSTQPEGEPPDDQHSDTGRTNSGESDDDTTETDGEPTYLFTADKIVNAFSGIQNET